MIQDETAPLGDNTPQEGLPTCSEDGVDLTLIRWMLSLSPLERLRIAQRYASAARRLRNAPRRVRLRDDFTNACAT